MTNDKDSRYYCPVMGAWIIKAETAPRQPTQSDALREALERIGVGMMPPEIIEGKLTLRLMRVDIAQEQSK